MFLNEGGQTKHRRRPRTVVEMGQEMNFVFSHLGDGCQASYPCCNRVCGSACVTLLVSPLRKMQDAWLGEPGNTILGVPSSSLECYFGQKLLYVWTANSLCQVVCVEDGVTLDCNIHGLGMPVGIFFIFLELVMGLL